MILLILGWVFVPFYLRSNVFTMPEFLERRFNRSCAVGLEKVGGFAGLRAALSADYFHMIKPSSNPNFPWTGIFFGAPILGVWYWCTDQVIVQRVLSAKDEGHAKAATIFSDPALLNILPRETMNGFPRAGKPLLVSMGQVNYNTSRVTKIVLVVCAGEGVGKSSH